MNSEQNIVRLKLPGPTPPSFKNAKRAILDRNTGHMRTMTQKDVAARKKKLEDDLLSALLSAYQTTAPATSTASSLRSWIVSSLPADDSWKFVPKIEIEAVRSDEPYVMIEIKPL
jgi:hypothetical protein